MIKQLLTSAAIATGALSLAACTGEGEVGVTYTEARPVYVAPGPPVGFYEGTIYYDNFDTYWHHHHDWNRDYAYRQWERHPREFRREERREQERREERRENRRDHD